MSDQEILTKAIEKAIAAGWQTGLFVAATDWRVLNAYPRQFLSVITPDPMIFDKVLENKIYVFELIFSQSFAKALLGEEPFYTNTYNKLEVAGDDGSYFSEVVLEAWQYHLQQMVIAEDPIAYLGKNL